MQNHEALYVAEFGDVVTPGVLRNGGVVVLETGKVFGGDSGYYYLGSYEVDGKGSSFKATGKVVKHNPAWHDAFGDTAQQFDIEMTGTIGTNGIITGHIKRLDKPNVSLPLRLTKKATLP